MILSTDGSVLQNFSDLEVRNNLPVHVRIPARIQAEDFVLNVGLELEETEDTGGGQNIGYTHTGDYLDYRIAISAALNYNLNVRVACESNAGKLAFQQLDEAGSILNQTIVDVPVTGGWQRWQTVAVTMKLDEGRGILRMKILDPEFNVNWFEFTGGQLVSGLADLGIYQLFPNPSSGLVHVKIPENRFSTENEISILSLDGRMVFSGNHLTLSEYAELDLHHLKKGMYLFQVRIGDQVLTERLILR